MRFLQQYMIRYIMARKRAFVDEELRRLFLGGVDPEADKTAIERAVGVLLPRDLPFRVDVYASPTNPNNNRGFAFIDFDTHAEAERGRLAMLNGVKVGNMWASIDWASPEQKLSDQVISTLCNIYIRHLRPNVERNMVLQHFGVREGLDEGSASVIESFHHEPGKAYAFMLFHSHQAASAAIEKYNGTELCGLTIEVTWARPVPEGAKKKEFNAKSVLNMRRVMYGSKGAELLGPIWDNVYKHIAMPLHAAPSSPLTTASAFHTLQGAPLVQAPLIGGGTIPAAPSLSLSSSLSGSLNSATLSMGITLPRSSLNTAQSMWTPISFKEMLRHYVHPMPHFHVLVHPVQPSLHSSVIYAYAATAFFNGSQLQSRWCMNNELAEEDLAWQLLNMVAPDAAASLLSSGGLVTGGGSGMGGVAGLPVSLPLVSTLATPHPGYLATAYKKK